MRRGYRLLQKMSQNHITFLTMNNQKPFEQYFVEEVFLEKKADQMVPVLAITSFPGQVQFEEGSNDDIGILLLSIE